MRNPSSFILTAVIICLAAGLPASGAVDPAGPGAGRAQLRAIRASLQESLPAGELARPYRLHHLTGVRQVQAEGFLAEATAAIYVAGYDELLLAADTASRTAAPRLSGLAPMPGPDNCLGEGSLTDFLDAAEAAFGLWIDDPSVQFLVKTPTCRSGIDPGEARGVVKAAPGAVLLSDSFESDPWQWWVRGGTVPEQYLWERTQCAARTGGYSVDGVRGGTAGSLLTCAGLYPHSVETWMINGDCLNLWGAEQAWLDHYFTASLEAGADLLSVLFYDASTTYWWGWQFGGNWTANWFHHMMNLRQMYYLGDLTQYDCNRFLFAFRSDGSISSGFGCRVDDVTVMTDPTPYLGCSILRPDRAFVGIPVQFVGEMYNYTTDPNLEWRFGDNTFSYERYPYKTYLEPGTYYADLVIWNDLEATHASKAIQVIQAAAGGVGVVFDAAARGKLYPDCPSQVAPASYLTFKLWPDSFPNAGPDLPAIIEIVLPQGVFLSQTLATGNVGTVSPTPEFGETVVNLAVSEYASGQTGRPLAAASSRALEISANAVQLFRYVAGENRIWIRINESTSGWVAPENTYIGFTIGLGENVWPQNSQNNWGEPGLYSQSSTLFYLDARGYNPESFDFMFPVTFNSFYQFYQTPAGAAFLPAMASLLTFDGWIELTESSPVVSQIGGVVTDKALADMDGDGRDDCISIDAARNRLSVAYGQPDGSFIDWTWWRLTGGTPATVEAADISGDGRPDVLVGTTAGELEILLWEDLFAVKTLKSSVAEPYDIHPLSGAPTASVLADVNGDHLNDYLFTDGTANTLQVMLGNGFTLFGSYNTSANPVALAAGDWNGDLAVDVAVANRGSGSVTVYTNDGAGAFTAVELAGVGGQPADLDAADFNVDGRDDLAVALSGDKALAVLLRGADDAFHPAAAQKVYFAKTPSAVVADNYDGQLGPDALVGFADWNKLSLCLSDAAGAVNYAYNIDTLGDVVVDPFNNVTLAADSIITVGAGTSLGGVSSQQGMAGVSQRPFGVVHFPRSSAISFSVVNLAAVDALAQLELYGDDGKLVTAAPVTLGPGAQYARYFTDVLGPEAAAADRWVRGFLSVGEAYGLWLVNDAGLNYLDGTRAPDVREAYSEQVVPVVAGTTELVLINPHKAAAAATLTVRGGDGTVKGTVARRLEGRTRQVIDVGTLARAVGSGDWVEVRSDRGLSGVEIFGDGMAKGCLGGLPPGAPNQVLYSPHVAVGDFGVVYRTELTLVNTGEYEASPRVVLVGDGGTAVASVDVVVPARGKTVVDLGPALGISGAATGYLRIEGIGAARLAGSVTFGDAAGGRFVSCLPLLAEGWPDYLLGHIANGEIGGIGFFTGLAVLNVDWSARTVTVRAFDQAGVQRGEAVLELQPNQRVVNLLSGLMPELTSLFGGYLTIDAPPGSRLLVFELFGDGALNFLSAVPAAPLPSE